MYDVAELLSGEKGAPFCIIWGTWHGMERFIIPPGAGLTVHHCRPQCVHQWSSIVDVYLRREGRGERVLLSWIEPCRAVTSDGANEFSTSGTSCGNTKHVGVLLYLGYK